MSPFSLHSQHEQSPTGKSPMQDRLLSENAALSMHLCMYFLYTAEEQTKEAFERHFETQINLYHEQVCMCC